MLNFAVILLLHESGYSHNMGNILFKNSLFTIESVGLFQVSLYAQIQGQVCEILGLFRE